MNATVKAEIVKRAKATAGSFVEEFGEPLDPETTDWDAVAWQDDRRDMGFDPSSSDYDEWWPVYQIALIAETERLCS